MQSLKRVIAVLAVAVGAAVAVSCAGPASDAVSSDGGGGGTCTSDLSCVYGEECGRGGCEGIAPGLYTHIQTASALLRSPLDQSEVDWRAAHYDLLIGGVLGRTAEMRAVNPTARLIEYMDARYHRYAGFGTEVEDWAAANGYDPEDFYLHFREDTAVPTWESTVIVEGFPPGVIPGWNPDAGPGDPPASASTRAESRIPGFNAGGYTGGDPWRMGNINHPGYRRFLAHWATMLMDGSVNGPPIADPIDGVVFDNGIYYPQWGEGVLEKSDEYYGIPLDEHHPHALGFATFYPEVTAALAGYFGMGVDVMPNYGHVLFLEHPDQASRAVTENTAWIWAEVWLTYMGGSTPTTGSSRVITYDYDYAKAVVSVIRRTRGSGRLVIGARDLGLSSFGTDRGKLLSLALYYLVHNANTYYAYETVRDHSHILPLADWAWNPAAEFDVGVPDQIPQGTTDFDGNSPSDEHWVFAEGQDPYRPDLTYRVLARRFTNALVLVKMLPAGSVVDNQSITTHDLGGQYVVLQADGTLGGVVTQATIRNNEGLILIPVN